MKRLLFVFLFFPILLVAQYPNTGNKQRLGYQTTADGLIWRGVAGDTINKPIGINMPYFQLDTVNGILRRYIATKGKWQQISGTGGGGSGLTIPVDSITFNSRLTEPLTRELKYSTDNETLVFGAGSTTIEIGQKDAWYVKNQTGSTITKGTVVRASGTLGSSGRILISPMVIDGTVDSKYLLGITASNIANGSDGYVIHFGKLRKFNTSSWVDGTVLYAGTGGTLTSTEPNPPNLRLPIAFVVHSHVTNGILAIRIQTGNELHELHDVDTTGIADGGTLVWDEALSKWKAAPPDYDRDSTNEIQTLFFNSGTGDLDISGGNTVSLLGILNGYTSGTGTAGRIPYWNTTTSFANSPLLYNSTTKRTTWDSPGVIELPMGTDAQRPSPATTSDFWYNTTGNGIEWYNGTRWAKGLESTFNRGTATRVPYFDANGQITDNSAFFFASSTGVLTTPKLEITDITDNGTPDAGVRINRTLAAPIAQNGHGFRDQTIFTRSNNAYAAFDGAVSFTGSNNINHGVSFQSRIDAATSGTISDLWGVIDNNVISGSRVTRMVSFESAPYFTGGVGPDFRYGVRIRDVNDTAPGSVGQNYGIYIDSLGTGSNNFGIYVNGTKSGGYAIYSPNRNTTNYYGGKTSVGSVFNPSAMSAALTVDNVQDPTNLFPLIVSVASTANQRKSIIFKQDTRSNLSFSDFSGNFQPSLQLQSDDNTKMLWIGPSGGTNGNALLYAGATGFEVTTGSSVTSGGISRFQITNSGRAGFGVSTPTAVLHLKAGTASANTGPLKFTSGTNLTTPEAGAIEYDGTEFYATPSSVRHILVRALKSSATLNFPSTASGTSSSLTVTVTGATTSDFGASIMRTNASIAGTSYEAIITAADTVTVYFHNFSGSSQDPASGTFRVTVIK